MTKDQQALSDLPCKVALDTVVCVLEAPNKEYPLKNDETTFYVCRGHACLPPVNELAFMKGGEA